MQILLILSFTSLLESGENEFTSFWHESITNAANAMKK